MSKAIKDKAWKQAKKKYRLFQATVQMARELGLNPHKIGKIANHKQEPWKEPLPDFISDAFREKIEIKERP